MSRNGHFNWCAKWGFFLGLVLSASRLFELSSILSGDLDRYVLLSVEWVASLVLYFCIILWACRGRGYRFGEIFNSSILISLFASVLVGVCSHIYIVEFLGGYANYIHSAISAMQDVLSEAQAVASSRGLDSDSSSLLGGYFDRFVGDSDALLQGSSVASSPSIFSAVFSMAMNYIVSGALFGAVVGLLCSQKGVRHE